MPLYPFEAREEEVNEQGKRTLFSLYRELMSYHPSHSIIDFEVTVWLNLHRYVVGSV